MATSRKTVPQKPKPASRKPKAKATPRKRTKPDPRRAPKDGLIPSDNPNQSRTF